MIKTDADLAAMASSELFRLARVLDQAQAALDSGDYRRAVDRVMKLEWAR